MAPGRLGGVVTAWLAWGASPQVPTDALVRLGVADLEDPRTHAEVILSYHLLWELTQAWLEEGLEGSDPSETCVTCADEARVVEVVTCSEGTLATVLDRGRPSQLDVSLVGTQPPGALVRAHGGVAIAVVPVP